MAAKIIAILAAGIFLTSSAHAKSKPVPVAHFPAGTTDLPERLAGLCVDRSSLVIEQDASHVLCSRSVEGMQGALAQVLVGNAYSTTPELKVRFSIVRSDQDIRVQASQWVETQMAFGQVRRLPLDNKKHTENMLTLLEGIGGTRETQ